MPRFAKYEENEEPISGYRLVDFLGAGQFGEVWKAVDTESGIFTAIKIIDLSHSTSALKELKALNLVRNLRHPNLVPIFTARLKDKNGKEHPLHKAEEVKGKGQLRELIIAMGLGDHSLSARLKQLNPDGTDPADYKGIPVEELIPLMEGAARGIDYLNKKDHGLGKGVGDGPIIHCDIKPDNMMVVAGEVQIADCGVAVIITPDARQTKAAGSPAYSAPELTGNKPVPGTDQYALAISYYELRTGKLPFDESMGQLSIMLAHAEGRLEFSSPVLSEYETRVLKWATAVQPKMRYPSCMDMVKQLGRAQYDLPPLAPDQIGSKSGVVAVPLDRSKSGTTKKAEPPKKADPPKPKHPSTAEFRPVAEEDLRGTVIPDSDRMLPPSQAGFTLPAGDSKPGAGSPAAKYQASQSDIVIPTPGGGYTRDEDFDPDAPAARPPAASAAPVDLAQSLIVERPQISVDSDDPLGAQHRTIEVDDEIKKIIRQNTPMHTPAARGPVTEPPAAGPRLPSNPVIVPPVSPGKRSTQFPRETPPAEDDEPKGPPPWAKEPDTEKSLPPWAKEAEAEKVRSRSSEYPPVGTSNTWKPAAPAPAKSGLPAKLIVGGVIAGGIAAGAFFVLGKGGGGKPAGVDVALIQPIKDRIKEGKWDAAEEALAALPADAAYDAERTQLKEQIAKGRGQPTPPPPPPPGPGPGPNPDPAKKLIADINALVQKGDKASLQQAEALNKDLARMPGYDVEATRLTLEIGEADKTRIAREVVETKKQIDALLRTESTKSLDEAEQLVPKLRPNFNADADRYADRIAEGRKRIIDSGIEEQLAALEKKSVSELPAAAVELQKQTILKPEKQKAFVRRLLAIGDGKPAFRPAILDVLTGDGKATPDNKFAQRVEDPTDREAFFKWKVADLDGPYDAAVKAVEALGVVAEPLTTTVDAAQKAVAAFKTAVNAAGTPFGPVWNRNAVLKQEMRDFLAVADAWASAHYRPDTGLPAFADFFKGTKLTAPTAPAAAFAMEYLRLESKRTTFNLANLRAVRDASKKWANVSAEQVKRIDDLYQTALAFQLQDLLRSAAPDWAKIDATAEKDHGHGWAALAKAEQKFIDHDLSAALALVAEGEKHAATKDPTAAARAAYATYLRGVVGRDPKTADALAAVYQPAVPEILNTAPRTKAAGEWLNDTATPTAATKLTLSDVLGGSGKVYEKDDKALKRMEVAVDLAGASHPDWALKLSLLALACDQPAVADRVAGRVKLAGLTAGHKNDDLLANLAFCLKRAKATSGPDRATAYAAAARLAIHAAEFDFDDCKTLDDVEAKELKIYKRIQTELIADGLKSSPSDSDRVSLNFAKFRTDPVSAVEAWIAAVDAFQSEIGKGHPDRDDFLALRSFATLFRFRARGDLGPTAAADDADRERVWKQMVGGLAEALDHDPEHSVANRTMAYVVACEFGTYPSYPPPPSRRRRDGQEADNLAYALKGVGYFDRAAAAMATRKNYIFWAQCGAFLHRTAVEMARAGEPADRVKAVLDRALAAVKNADAQRGTANLRYDEPRLLGGIADDLARLAGADPKANFAAALAYLKTDRPTKTPGEKALGAIDRARVMASSARAGAAVGDLKAAAPELEDEAIAAAGEPFPAVAQYWLGVVHRTAGNADKADEAFANAAKAFAESTAAPDVHYWSQKRQARVLHGWALAHRAENALDVLEGRRKGTFDAAKVAAEAADALEALNKDNPAVFGATTLFVPDYVRGRLALAAKGPKDAAPHFKRAYASIAAATKDRSLRVEDPFAVRCLAYELDRCGAEIADERARRKELLTDLETRFRWALTDDDRKLVAQVKGR